MNGQTNEPRSRRPRRVHPIFWIGLPAASLAMKFLLPFLGEARWEHLMTSEFGFVENATVVFLLVAIVLSVPVFLRRRELPRGVGWVMLLLGLGCLYFAGEEISWGQHFFHYRTPELVAHLNRQHEFNIHNTYGKYGGNLFNNLPRQLLNVAMVLAMLVPLLGMSLERRLKGKAAARRRGLSAAAGRLLIKSKDRRSAWHWLLPDHAPILAASMAVLLRLPDKIAKSSFPLRRQTVTSRCRC